MKTIIDHIRMNGKYFEVRSGGINYKYIEADELMDFISQVVKSAVLTKDKKELIYTHD